MTFLPIHIVVNALIQLEKISNPKDKVVVISLIAGYVKIHMIFCCCNFQQGLLLVLLINHRLQQKILHDQVQFHFRYKANIQYMSKSKSGIFPYSKKRATRSGLIVSKNICLHHQLINVTDGLLWANIVGFVIILFSDLTTFTCQPEKFIRGYQ